MIEWLDSAGNAPFVIALLVMLGLAAVELIAAITGFSVNDVVDDLVVSHSAPETTGGKTIGMDAASVDAPGLFARFLAWLYVGKVPVLMVIVILLSVFGLLGLVAQGLLRSAIGVAAPAYLAAPVVLVASLPIVRACTAVIARILPSDQSSAVDPSSFVGRTARITTGVARVGMPAEARLRDNFGTDHHVLVEPEDPNESFPAGSVVLLVNQTAGGRFIAIGNPNDILADLE